MVKVQLPLEARVDLSATVSGQFSSEDWSKILVKAENDLNANMISKSDLHSAWQNVVRDFYNTRYWGFLPKSKAQLKQTEPPPKRKNMGVQLIWITFNTMCVSKVAVLWFGQSYSNGHSSDLWWFLLCIAGVLLTFGHFLWRNRNYED